MWRMAWQALAGRPCLALHEELGHGVGLHVAVVEGDGQRVGAYTRLIFSST
jgi:hypothetical protein